MTVQPDIFFAAQGSLLGDGAIVIGASYGNDSIALIQWCREQGFQNVTSLYNDTGWSWPAHGNHESWASRVERMEKWVCSIGYKTARTASIGMEALVLSSRGSGWPRQGMQFCTEVLKIKPTQLWLAEHDPMGAAIFMNGKRRAESTNRAQTVEWIEDSWAHGGRRLRQPLYAHDDAERDALILRAGHEVLPHKSRECICVNANATDLQQWPEVVVATVERVEAAAGFTKDTGKPKTMFRPAKKKGATGIREVIRWSHNGKEFRALDDGTGPDGIETGCAMGFCGT